MSSIKSILSVWLGAIVLCAPALLNNYPFLYPDTGTYLVCAFNNEVSEMRPLTYGLFMRHASLMESLWLVVFIQALIVSWITHRFIVTFFKNIHPVLPVVIITILTLMTGVGEVTGMLMPDFASPVMIMSLCILLFGELKATWKLILTGLLLVFSVACHHSNAYTATAVILFYLFMTLFLDREDRKFIVPLKRVALPAILVIAGFFTIPLLHQARMGEFYWSKAKSVFVTNRINQMGLLKPFLEEKCAGNNYTLCHYKDEIPYDFMWDANSPLNKGGGWTAHNEEYRVMLKDFFKDPFYVKKFVFKTLENGIVQFFTLEGKVIFRESEGMYAYQTMLQVWPDQIGALRRSMQYSDMWKSNLTQVLQRFLVYGSFLYFFWILVFAPSQSFSKTHKYLIALILVALLANAFVCAGISMVDVRFQYRVVWLVPLVVLCILAERFRDKFSYQHEKPATVFSPDA